MDFYGTEIKYIFNHRTANLIGEMLGVSVQEIAACCFMMRDNNVLTSVKLSETARTGEIFRETAVKDDTQYELFWLIFVFFIKLRGKPRFFLPQIKKVSFYSDLYYIRFQCNRKYNNAMSNTVHVDAKLLATTLCATSVSNWTLTLSALSRLAMMNYEWFCKRQCMAFAAKS